MVRRVDRRRLRPSTTKLPSLGKGLETSVVGLFDVGGKATSGQLLGGKVASQTITTHAALLTGCVGAPARLQVFLLLAFHWSCPSQPLVTKKVERK